MKVIVILSFFLIQSFVYLASSSASQCGKLDINCPLHMRGSGAHCKDGFLEVICEGNNTIWNLEGKKYLITEISYSNKTIQLVDPSLFSSPCPIPNQIFPSDFVNIITSSLIVVLSVPFQTYFFLNCSQELKESDFIFFPIIPVPCLSIGGSNIYVSNLDSLNSSYGAFNAVPDYCGAFAGIMSNENLTAGSDVFMILQKGFLVQWYYSHPSSVKQCMKMLRHRHSWNTTFGNRLHTVLTDEYFALSCVFNTQNGHILFGLGVLLTLCVNVAVLLLVGRMIVAPVVIYIFLMYKYWNSFLNSIDAIEKFLQRHATFSVRRYDFSDIVAITSHFKEKLGDGGFGAVYKGSLLNGSMLVAVKMLNDSKFGGDDFLNEVGTIGKIHHANIVQLIGFCAERSKRALIYEYMSNGSLDKFIFSRTRSNGATLTIEKRKEIAIGIARGIDYLHRGCNMQILHFDIKPHNILLDNNLNPKISDFGMAKLYPREYNSVVVSAYGGTLGYIAPELVSRSFGTISHKADVYSFGMLLLELAGGRKNVDTQAESQNQVYYPSWIYDQLTEKENDGVTNVTVNISKIEGNLAKVGLWCIQSNPSNRPSMNRVIEMLQMEEDNLEMPPKPFANITPEKVPTLDSILESGSIEFSVMSEEISLVG